MRWGDNRRRMGHPWVEETSRGLGGLGECGRRRRRRGSCRRGLDQGSETREESVAGVCLSYDDSGTKSIGTKANLTIRMFKYLRSCVEKVFI